MTPPGQTGLFVKKMCLAAFLGLASVKATPAGLRLHARGCPGQAISSATFDFAGLDASGNQIYQAQGDGLHGLKDLRWQPRCTAAEGSPGGNWLLSQRGPAGLCNDGTWEMGGAVAILPWAAGAAPPDTNDWTWRCGEKKLDAFVRVELLAAQQGQDQGPSTTANAFMILASANPTNLLPVTGGGNEFSAFAVAIAAVLGAAGLALLLLLILCLRRKSDAKAVELPAAKQVEKSPAASSGTNPQHLDLESNFEVEGLPCPMSPGASEGCRPLSPNRPVPRADSNLASSLEEHERKMEEGAAGGAETQTITVQMDGVLPTHTTVGH